MPSKPEDKQIDKLSKSEVKRRMTALQELGEKLVNLSNDLLNKISLDENLKRAILEAKLIKSGGAKRRQLQYIGKLMRHIDPDQIITGLDKIELKTKNSKYILHQIEKWRDNLISENDNTLEKFLNLYNTADSQHLRQIIRKCQKNTEGANKELFRYIKNIIDTNDILE